MDYPIRLAEQLRAHLRALRKQRGLTQDQLGQHLGLSQVRIAEIEARPGVVSVDQLVRILSVLGATIFLRGRTEGGRAAPASKRRSAPKKDRTRTATTRALVTKPGKGSW